MAGAQVSAAHSEGSDFSGLGSKACKRIRTVDIHIGNVCAPDTQTAGSQTVASVEIDTCSKYAANTVRIKHVSCCSVGEWSRDPDHSQMI